MFFEILVYCLVGVLLVVFSFNNYRKTQRAFILAVLSLQVIATVVEITSLFYSFEKVSFYIQFFIFIFGVVIPSLLFFAEYVHINIYEIIDIKLGDRQIKKEKYEKAIQYYQKAIIQNTNNADTYVKLGRAYNAIGDRRTAFDRFAKAVELNRNDYRSYYEIGVIFNDLNKKQDAGLMLDNALRIKPDYTKASELLAEVLCGQNKLDEAIDVYKDAIKYAPDNYELFYKMGVIHTELRDFNEALDCYKSVIKINPEYYEAYFSMGQIYLLKGEFDNSIEAFQNSTTDRDIAGRAYYQIAKVYILKENEVEAVENIKKAIDIDPTYGYKAEKEPMFSEVLDYLEGIKMVTSAQRKLEQDIDKKVKEKFDEEYQFNFFDKFDKK